MARLLAIALALAGCACATICPSTRKFNQVAEAGAGSSGIPHTLLLSFEGSGNTWTRWLFENSTGVCM